MTTVDYLRIATWELNTYTSLAAKTRVFAPIGWKPMRWLQYKGYRSEEGLFYGSGDQLGARHHVFHCSGPLAHEYYNLVMSMDAGGTIYCTRLDLQQTIPHPKIDLRKVFKSNSRKAKTWIESDSQTIYIGARTSDRFTRLYQKLDQRFLRLEHELKGKLARSVFATCQQNTDDLAVLQNQFIVSTRKSKLGSIVTSAYNLEPDILVSRDAEIISAESEREIERKITYLENTEIALEKYLNNHALRNRTIALIERLHLASLYDVDSEREIN